ncbi:hypothetical protein GEMRC1_006962 [Eukaryota sp. GEM-RC1]
MSFILDSSLVLPTLLRNNLHHDVLVLVRDEQIKLHKAVLAPSSVRFSRFFSKMTTAEGVVEIDATDDMEYLQMETIRSFFGFFYGETVELSVKTLTDMSYLAKFYKVTKLSAACSTFVEDSSQTTISLNTNEILTHLHSENIFSDYSFVFNDLSIPIHKCILGHSCKFFQKLWENEKGIQQYDFNSNFTPESILHSNLQLFVCALYSQEVPINIDTVYDLFYLSNVTSFDALAKQVETVMNENLSTTEWTLKLMERADAEGDKALIVLISPFVTQLTTTQARSSKLTPIVLKLSTLLELSDVDIDWRVESLVKSFKESKDKSSWTHCDIEQLTNSFADTCVSMDQAFSLLVEPLVEEESLFELLIKFSLLVFNRFVEESSLIPSKWLSWTLIVADKLSSTHLDDVINVCNQPATLKGLEINDINWQLESLVNSYFDTLTTSSWSIEDLQNQLIETITDSIDLSFVFTVVIKQLHKPTNENFLNILVVYSAVLFKQHSNLTILPPDWLSLCLSLTAEDNSGLFDFFASIIPSTYPFHSNSKLKVPTFKKQNIVTIIRFINEDSRLILWLIRVLVESWLTYSTSEWEIKEFMKVVKN